MKITANPDEVKRLHDSYKNNTIIDFEKGSLTVESTPIIWARSSLLYNMFWEMKKLVGDAVVEVMHRIGRPYGMNFYQMTTNTFESKGMSLEKSHYLQYLANETAAIGWGNISIEMKGGDIIDIACEHGSPVGVLSKKNNKNTSYCVDTYFLGYFEGFITALMDKDYSGEYLECVGKGDDRCLMRFMPKV